MLYVMRLHGALPGLDVVKLGQSAWPDWRCVSVRRLVRKHFGLGVRVELVRVIRDRRGGERAFHARFADRRLVSEFFLFHPDMLTHQPKAR